MARASLFAHPEAIDILAPQAYSVDENGALVGSIDPIILNFAKKHKIKILPLLTNKNFGQTIANTILDDQIKQDMLINEMALEARQQEYYGWQIDFEGMDASYKDRYSAFISRVGNALKNQKMIFSVAVIAQISADPNDYKNDLWNKVIGVYDYAALAPSVDFISIMSYDAPDSKGPIAPYPWLEKVLDYSLKYIPAEKISLGIPLYYWKWDDATGKLLDIGGYKGIQKTLKRKSAHMGYSKTEQAPFIKYKIKGVPYTLWYENGKSITQKIKLIKKNKLQGFSAWVLGLEVPSVYTAPGF